MSLALGARLGGDENARREFWAALALRHCKGLGPRSVCRLLRFFGSAYEAVRGRSRWSEAGIGRNKADHLASGDWRTAARKEWDDARRLSASLLLWTDMAYPSLLRHIADAPPLLYARGDLSLLRAPAFAVIGARRASPHGRSVAAHMARSLSACGITIVSGMALGIDRVAHQAALPHVGRSVGVLGTGIDRIYPQSNADIFEGMERHGLLLTEFAPGTAPLQENFPVRNRIISGLSLGVLVVEAAERSGSLITARLALEQNREVYAVPGPALDTRCQGSQELVRQGARAVFCAEDVLRDMAERLRPFGIGEHSLAAGELCGPAFGGAPPGDVPLTAGADAGASTARTGAPAPPSEPGAAASDAAPPRAAGDMAAARLTEGDATADLLSRLREHGPALADDLALATGLSAAAASAALVGLEMLGQVRRLPGARYEALT